MRRRRQESGEAPDNGRLRGYAASPFSMANLAASTRAAQTLWRRFVRSESRAWSRTAARRVGSLTVDTAPG